MLIVLKNQLKPTNCLLSRALSIFLIPNSFQGINFSSSNSVSTLHNHTENNSNPTNLDLLAHLQHDPHGPSCNSYVLNKLISSCAASRSLYLGIQIHSFIYKIGICSHVYISTALVDMYGKCGVISNAHKLFDEMPHRNVITYNSLISGYLHTQYVDVAIDLFMQMFKSGISPTHFTFSTVFVGCSQLESVQLGEQIHGLCTKYGFLFNIVVGTALLEMYWKCYDWNNSRRIFDDLPDKNAVTWTSMITGYSQNQQTENTMHMIKEMLAFGYKPDMITYNTLLSSFCNPKDKIYLQQIHSQIIKEGLESDLHISVTLVTVYSQCGSSSKDFYKFCSTVPIRNNISCNAIIAGFSNLGNDEKALRFFSEMRKTCIAIDFFTIASILKVIGVTSAIKAGIQIHALIIKSSHGSNIYIQNGLISMYAKCGKINEAKSIFSSMVDHDTISWNSLLSGYAQHGYGKEAVEAFDQMRKVKVKPDLTTFLIVISACSHVGWIDKGLELVELMRNDCNLEPLKVEHYACIVDLYARSGYLKEAEKVIDSMEIEVGPSVYKALLSGCRIYGNKEIGMRIARKFVDRFPNDPAGYVQLSYILDNDDSASVHNVMCVKGIKKKAGCSWI